MSVRHESELGLDALRKSLSDMLNCSISMLSSLGSQLMLYELIFDRRPRLPESLDDLLSAKLQEDVLGWLKIADLAAGQFQLPSVRDRIGTLRKLAERGMSYRRGATELRVLRELINAGLKDQLIYRYPDDKAAVLSAWTTDWSEVVRAFPSAKADIFAAVDLWALSHPTAAVFQFMRVLEHGLRALARDVGRTFEAESWGVVIDGIEAEIRTISKALPRGEAKNERMGFLSAAAKEFVYFKDGWRNFAAHGRATYDDEQGRIVMEHVRSFMTTLSSRLYEIDEG